MTMTDYETRRAREIEDEKRKRAEFRAIVGDVIAKLKHPAFAGAEMVPDPVDEYVYLSNPVRVDLASGAQLMIYDEPKTGKMTVSAYGPRGPAYDELRAAENAGFRNACIRCEGIGASLKKGDARIAADIDRRMGDDLARAVAGSEAALAGYRNQMAGFKDAIDKVSAAAAGFVRYAGGGRSDREYAISLKGPGYEHVKIKADGNCNLDFHDLPVETAMAMIRAYREIVGA